MIRPVLLVCFLHFANSQIVPSILEVSPLLIKDVNDTAEIFCKVRNLGQSSINWNREKGGRSSTVAINSVKGLMDDRIKVEFDNKASIATSTLRIAGLQPLDAAVYRCSVSLPQGDEIGRDVTLQIRSPPYFVGNTSDKVTSPLNGSVTLECYGGGYPAPTVTWTRENNAPLPNGAASHQSSVLKINNVQKEHAGAYLCTMDNKVSTSIKKTYQLQVQYPPIVKPRNNRVGQAVGHETYLECQIESEPAVTIIWLHDNIPISDNQFYTISQSAIDDPHRTTTLKIKVEKKQYGTYTCVASNPFGKDAASIELYQTDQQVCVQNCDVSSGHSIISSLELKLSFTSVIIFLFHWQNM